jgi:hypothetical protein
MISMELEALPTGCETILGIASDADVAARRLLRFEDVDSARLREVSQRFRAHSDALPGNGDDAWWIASLDQLARAYQHGCATAGRQWAGLAARYTADLRERMATTAGRWQ